MFPNIRAEMARNNYTIKRLADEIGLSANGLSFKMLGKKEFTLAELSKISNIFNCSIDYLAERNATK